MENEAIKLVAEHNDTIVIIVKLVDSSLCLLVDIGSFVDTIYLLALQIFF